MLQGLAKQKRRKEKGVSKRLKNTARFTKNRGKQDFCNIPVVSSFNSFTDLILVVARLCWGRMCANMVIQQVNSIYPSKFKDVASRKRVFQSYFEKNIRNGLHEKQKEGGEVGRRAGALIKVVNQNTNENEEN